MTRLTAAHDLPHGDPLDNAAATTSCPLGDRGRRSRSGPRLVTWMFSCIILLRFPRPTIARRACVLR